MSCTTPIITQTIKPCSGDTIQFISEVAIALPGINYSVVKADANFDTILNRTLVINPKGTGALTTTRPDSTVVGGNIRGTRAVDLQIDRTLVTQVASGNFSVIGGGSENVSSSEASTVAGGNKNISSNQVSTVGGGDSNRASGIISTVSGGSANRALGDGSTIGGGQQNTAAGIFNTVGGGNFNTAISIVSTISGGSNNNASGNFSTIGGGLSNAASGGDSTVAGGRNNNASANFSTIGGGSGNIVPGSLSTIGGGNKNTASGDGSIIAGGDGNTASGDGSTISGGTSNIASGSNSTIPGGQRNTASGNNSFAFGINARAIHNNSLVWGSSIDGPTNSSSPNQWLINLRGVPVNPMPLPNSFFLIGDQLVSGLKNLIMDHPLRENTYLRHFSAEGPRPDLVYRGLTNLIDGKADIDIDLASKMTALTFSKITKDPQVFLTNRSSSDWVRVDDYDTVHTGKFTIISENQKSTAKIDWLVVAERDMGDENVDPEIEKGNEVSEMEKVD